MMQRRAGRRFFRPRARRRTLQWYMVQLQRVETVATQWTDLLAGFRSDLGYNPASVTIERVILNTSLIPSNTASAVNQFEQGLYVHESAQTPASTDPDDAITRFRYAEGWGFIATGIEFGVSPREAGFIHRDLTLRARIRSDETLWYASQVGLAVVDVNLVFSARILIRLP